MPVTEYYWDELSDNVLMETDEDGNASAVYTNEPDVFGELVSQERDSVESFYHFDGQGSTRELIDFSETVTDEYTYTAFGETVASSGGSGNVFRYNGEVGYYRHDPVVIYIRRRYYHTRIGLWLSLDPAFPGISPRVYVHNNPINAKGAIRPVP